MNERGEPRGLAIEALLRIEDGAYAHILVPELLRRSRLPTRDRGLVTDLVYGSVRLQRVLDHLIGTVSNRPVTKLDPPVRAALRLGAYQLLAGVAPHAAVGETVRVVPARGRGFVNGVLRSLARAGPPWPLPTGTDVWSTGVRTSHPDWIVQLLFDEFGPDAALATLERDNEPPLVTLRPNPIQTTAGALTVELEAAGVEVHRGALVPDALQCRNVGDLASLPAVVEGRATPQDQTSQAVVACLDPRPGDTVLDLAAAPGGKATASAERMHATGLVVAADLHPGRVRTVARAATRLGLDGVLAPLVGDGRHPPVRAGVFDRVLLDAPCTGLGVLRRRPDARWRVRREDVRHLAALQRVLLEQAALAVAPGGRLVYAVCTLSREETVGVDEWASRHLPALHAEPPPAAPWRPHGRGAILLPSDVGTDGMFVLSLRRRAESAAVSSSAAGIEEDPAPRKEPPGRWHAVQSGR